MLVRVPILEHRGLSEQCETWGVNCFSGSPKSIVSKWSDSVSAVEALERERFDGEGGLHFSGSVEEEVMTGMSGMTKMKMSTVTGSF